MVSFNLLISHKSFDSVVVKELHGKCVVAGFRKVGDGEDVEEYTTSLMAGDVLQSYNGIELSTVEGGLNSWNELFKAFSWRDMKFVVVREKLPGLDRKQRAAIIGGFTPLEPSDKNVGVANVEEYNSVKTISVKEELNAYNNILSMSKSVTNQRKNYKPATIHKTNQNVSKEVTLSKKDYAPAPRFRVSGHPPTSIRDLSVKGKVGDPFFMVRASDGNHYIIMTGDRYLASKTYNCDISTMPCHRRNFFNGGIYDDTNDYYILYHELLNNNDPAEVALIKEVRDPKSRKRLSESEEQAILDGVSAAIASGDSVVGNDSERWELKLVLPIDQINDPFGQQCERRSGCQLAACCIWSGSKDPSTPWYCCLDCQEKDFEGWPAENNDIPLKVMSRALRNAMITRCSKYPSPNMPNLPESEETNTRTRSSSQRRAAAVAASVISSSHSPQDSAAITSHPKRSAASVETSDSKPSRKRSKQLGSKRRDVITSTTPIDVRCFACFNINQKTASQCVTTATSSSCSRPEGNNCTFCGSSGNKWVPGTIDTGFVVLNNETNEALDLFKTKNEVYNNYYKNEEIGANALKNRLEPLINKDEDSVVLGSYRIERDNHVHFRNGKPGLNLRCLHEGCSWRTKNGKSYCGLHAKMHPGEA